MFSHIGGATMNRIKELRIAAGKSQAELADIIGVNKQAISRCRKRKTPHKCYIFRAAWQNSWHKKKTPAVIPRGFLLKLVVLFTDDMYARAFRHIPGPGDSIQTCRDRPAHLLPPAEAVITAGSQCTRRSRCPSARLSASPAPTLQGSR